MILVFFEKDGVFVSHHALKEKKQIFSIKDLLNEIDIAIPQSNRTKK
jgi:hypothetical protein